MRVKFLAQGNNRGLWWGSNSRLTSIHQLRVRHTTHCVTPPIIQMKEISFINKNVMKMSPPLFRHIRKYMKMWLLQCYSGSSWCVMGLWIWRVLYRHSSGHQAGDPGSSSTIGKLQWCCHHYLRTVLNCSWVKYAV